MTTAGIIALGCVAILLLLFLVPRVVQDRVLALVSLIGLIAFVAVVASFVGAPDLIIVFIIGGALAAYDFWRTTGPTGDGDNRDSRG